MADPDRPSQVLIVDDDVINCELIEAICTSIGYSCVTATSGAAALELLNSDTDLILLDAMMPGMSGFEVARTVRMHSQFVSTPIIMVTALSSKQDRLDAVDAGANDFITKPIDKTELRVRSASLIKMKRFQDALGRHREVLEQEILSRTSDLRAANLKLAGLAATDSITGLPNHHSLANSIDTEVARSNRTQRTCGILFLDLDHFKALNDACGHSAGDAALAEFGSVVRDQVRSIDVVGRWGGEEFIVLLPEAGQAEAVAVAERIRNGVDKHVFQVAGGGHLTCSIGVALYPEHGTNPSLLIASADQSCIAAKLLGRNQVRLASDPAVMAFAGSSKSAQTREDTTLLGIVDALFGLLRARDATIARHSEEVSTLAGQLAAALGLFDSEVKLVGFAGKLHDIGKVGTLDSVLYKHERLNEEEWEHVRLHPVIGAEIMESVPTLRIIASGIRGHHERWDGAGYPDGLKGEEIPIAARIVAVADAYCVMTKGRCYQVARDSDWALNELIEHSGTQFDPAIVKALSGILASSQARLLSIARVA